MHVISVRNVCEALPAGVEFLLTHGRKSSSRAGEVIVSDVPVVTIYSNPRERVLFSPIRDANPAFSLAEALWMLSGRNDAAFLNLFIKDFGERFAEPNGTIHGAYGHRWRYMFGFDQIKEIVRRLIENPNDRQCVLQHWDCEMQPKPTNDDLTGISTNDLRGNYKDKPCNLQVLFRILDGKLEIGVCCRSNDIIMGAYGANAVHFSILQEYMAAMIDVEVGTYTQFSFNYHMYVKDLEKLAKYDDRERPLSEQLRDNRYGVIPGIFEEIAPLPLVSDPESFDEEVGILLRFVETCVGPKQLENLKFNNKFLQGTAYPMLCAYLRRDLSMAQDIEAPDWRLALTEWLQRRQDKRRGK